MNDLFAREGLAARCKETRLDDLQKDRLQLARRTGQNDDTRAFVLSTHRRDVVSLGSKHRSAFRRELHLAKRFESPLLAGKALLLDARDDAVDPGAQHR